MKRAYFLCNMTEKKIDATVKKSQKIASLLQFVWKPNRRGFFAIQYFHICHIIDSILLTIYTIYTIPLIYWVECGFTFQQKAQTSFALSLLTKLILLSRFDETSTNHLSLTNWTKSNERASCLKSNLLLFPSPLRSLNRHDLNYKLWPRVKFPSFKNIW